MAEIVQWDKRHIVGLMDICALVAAGIRFDDEEREGILKVVLSTKPEDIEEVVRRFAETKRTTTGT